mgnify:CR=1 FL=1
MIMKRFYHAILACGVFAAVVAAVSCTKDATGGGGGGYNGEPEVNHDMDGILRRNYLWNEEYATLSPDFGLPYDEFLGDVLMRMKTNDLDKKFRNGRWQLYSNIQRLSPVSRVASVCGYRQSVPEGARLRVRHRFSGDYLIYR